MNTKILRFMARPIIALLAWFGIAAPSWAGIASPNVAPETRAVINTKIEAEPTVASELAVVTPLMYSRAQADGSVTDPIWSASFVWDVKGGDQFLVVARHVTRIRNLLGTGDWDVKLLFPTDKPGESIGASVSKLFPIADNLEFEGGVFFKATQGKPTGIGPYVGFVLRV